jgi:molecular chaperone GrpE
MSTEQPPSAPQNPEVRAEPTIEEQLQEYKDKYLRALAEIENTRKRLSREKLESQSFAVQNVVVDFLQPIDHFEQAMSHAERAPKEVADWARGFLMILQQLQQILADHGVSHFDSVGQLFDPHFHEAVETEERLDVPEGTILFEFQKGYRLGGRTIRAAKVRVATRQKLGTPDNDTETLSLPENA